ncbi:hypothetical protein ASZ90_018706 [hydrocarbon metagenome]|uniref:SnoaL-like domain-containing protein n=1 Tax=hydrocarbon metagenome TaxID=938273 RepID=A0A0W8E6A0_9ZZZZ
MGNEKRENLIIKLAMNFDNDLESKNLEKLPAYFSDDCQIELLGRTLKGREGIGEWLAWLFDNYDELRFVIINVIVKGNILFEEYAFSAVTSDGTKIQSRQAEVIEFDQCNKIRNLRLYFDRIDFAGNLLQHSVSKQEAATIK